MLCDRCKKRDAKILYTEIMNGAKKEEHLCEECATDHTSFQMDKTLPGGELTLGDLLSTLLDSYYGGEKKSGEVKAGIVCDHCGLSYDEFLQKGRFGCYQCYHSFQKPLRRTLKGIQGAEVHVGKRPKNFVSEMDKIIQGLTEHEKLSLKLQEAIEKEEFEEAAKIRDVIRAMKEEEMKNA